MGDHTRGHQLPCFKGGRKRETTKEQQPHYRDGSAIGREERRDASQGGTPLVERVDKMLLFNWPLKLHPSVVQFSTPNSRPSKSARKLASTMLVCAPTVLHFEQAGLLNSMVTLVVD